MVARSRHHLSTVVIALVAGMIGANAPAIAHGVQHALFAHNADKVDNLHAVPSSASTNNRKGKLVATNPTTGKLPNSIIGPIFARLDGVQQGGSFSITGDIGTDGMLETGSDQGTTESGFDEMVIRSTISSSITAGNVLARTNDLRLERDGTNGGLRFGWSNGAGPLNTGTCIGVTSTGAVVGSYNYSLGGPTAGTDSVFTDAQDVVQAECTFGYVSSGTYVTHVSLQRNGSGSVWQGYLQSSFNQ